MSERRGEPPFAAGLVSAFVLLLLPLQIFAQHTGKPARVGVLLFTTPSGAAVGAIDHFRPTSWTPLCAPRSAASLLADLTRHAIAAHGAC